MPAAASLGRNELFASTHWTLVLRAGALSASPAAQKALEQLCRNYWPAIYAYLRRRGYDPSDAQDLTQSFFQHILQNQMLNRASRERGRFRSFLLGALKLCLADEHARRSSLKRGGNVRFISVDALNAEELHEQAMTGEPSPEQMLDARWASLLLERAIDQLRTQLRAEGKATVFDTVAPFLGSGQPEISYENAAAQLGLGIGAVKSLISRTRRQFVANLRREIMQTVGAPHEVDDELRQLRSVFARALQQRA
ncbi:MAG: RNA polymerase subunit sigma-24 [Chthoniobacterales bacterium]|nr:MAG: RNA polymerase subunit sigma-24 [Chthoniobacterales bacterium]